MKKTEWRMFGCLRETQQWLFCVNHQAQGVRQDVGRLYSRDDWRAGWKKALKSGCRVVPVIVRREP